VCRRYLLGDIDAFGLPSTALYRSDLVRSRRFFFPGSDPNADLAACLSCLQTTDFGMVHQILCFERTHAEAISSGLRDLNSFLLDRIQFLREYGTIYLKDGEIEPRFEELLDDYYKFIAVAAFNFRNKAFWDYQRRRLDQLGYSLYNIRFAKAVSTKVLDLLFNPKKTVEAVLKRGNAAEKTHKTALKDACQGGLAKRVR
jgi:hypothetical protein